jgi:ferric-dicitrate binding protein FerR (iron transport regulator)
MSLSVEEKRARWRAATARWRANNPDRWRAYRAAHRAEFVARSIKYNRENPETVRRLRRERRLQQATGITLEAYAGMLAAQNGACYTCGSLPGQRPLHVDHNHVTGQIRKLLCTSCNSVITRLESPSLETWMRYLKEHQISSASQAYRST